MNCFENTASILQFIKTVSVGDKLVLYPRNIPDSKPWGFDIYSACDDDVVLEGDECNILHGNSPVFVEVCAVMNGFPNSASIHHAVYFKEITISPRMVVKLHMFINSYAPDTWECRIFARNHMIQTTSMCSNYSKMYYKPMIGIIRRDVLCENILAARQRHTERAMMREILAKKMGDGCAIDMIARALFPCM